MSKEKDGHPFGGFFMIIGGFVGLGYALQINDTPLVALGGALIGGWFGYIFEHVLFRVIVIGLFILMIVARQAFFGAVFEDMNALQFQDHIAPGLASAALSFIAPAANASDDETISAKDDYVTCWKQPCIYGPASEWSEQNPNGVAIAVAMGTKPAATDDQLKHVLSSDLKYYKVKKFKFFYEQNDVPATVFTLHVRGGTEGPFLIGDIRDQISIAAKRALNTNQLFQDS